jgi:hypothetical protein
MWESANPYVSSRGIRFEELLNGIDFSHGYQVLIKLAANLFFSRDITRSAIDDYPEIVVSPVELVTVLDEKNFGVAQAAIHLRRHSAYLNDLKGEE